MRKTHKKFIHVVEKVATVDGIGCNVDVSVLPDDWQAVTFHECCTTGGCRVEVEYVQDPFGSPKDFKANKIMTREEFENHPGVLDVFRQWMETPSYDEKAEEEGLAACIESQEANIEEAKADIDVLVEYKRKAELHGASPEDLATIQEDIVMTTRKLQIAEGAKAKFEKDYHAASAPRERRKADFKERGMKAVPRNV